MSPNHFKIYKQLTHMHIEYTFVCVIDFYTYVISIDIPSIQKEAIMHYIYIYI